jgi:tyrosyl-tRNA synthetase
LTDKPLNTGRVYLNYVRADLTRTVTTADLLFGKHLLLRKGKRTYAVLTTA